MTEGWREQLQAEWVAEMKVLEKLELQSSYAIEIEPDEHRVPGTPNPVMEAIVRCATAGWIEIGPASSRDPRCRITNEGREELERRRTIVADPQRLAVGAAVLGP